MTLGRCPLSIFCSRRTPPPPFLEHWLRRVQRFKAAGLSELLDVTLVSLSLRLKDLLGPVTRVKKKKRDVKLRRDPPSPPLKKQLPVATSHRHVRTNRHTNKHTHTHTHKQSNKQTNKKQKRERARERSGMTQCITRGHAKAQGQGGVDKEWMKQKRSAFFRRANHQPLSREHSTNKTVKARFWPWRLPVQVLKTCQAVPSSLGSGRGGTHGNPR